MDTANFSLSAFRSPANEFRSVAFFSLNDRLFRDEVRRQLAGFREAGFGGTFLHSRIGLLTEYLGEDWFEIIAAGIKDSQEFGIDAWFYDEDRWPSGFAGGIVPRQDPAFRARCLLRVKRAQPINVDDRVLFETGDYKYVCHVYPMGDPWFNGTAWVDLLNPDMVKAFIECTYAPYFERFGGLANVRGIFTDEPQVAPRPKISNEGAIPFSPVIVDVFKRRTGLDLEPLLPSLFSEVGQWRQIRLDYYRTVAACFEEAFSKQIGDYCRDAGLAFVGHYNAEETPLGGMLNEGGLMQQYRHMEIPGIDALGLHFPSIHCGKVMTSVANQYGRKRCLSELFGISGHNLSFEDRIWITAWHTLMGINFMVPHLSLYSMKGERKRDFPPTISLHQPYWRYNKLFEDYSARLCYFATVGESVPEICVISPIESDYIEHASGNANARDRSFDALLQSLLPAHRNFDLGDEQIISEIGRTENGRLIIGSMAYAIIILPSLLTIRATTLDLLVEFSAHGGTLLVVDSCPDYVDGCEDLTRLSALKKVATLVNTEDLPAVLPHYGQPLFTLEGAGSEQVWSHLRHAGGTHAIQFFNTSRLESHLLNLRFNDTALSSVLLLDPISGKSLRLHSELDGAYRLGFASAQSWVVVFGEIPADVAIGGNYQPPLSPRKEVLKLDGDWQGRRLDPNAIALDFARASMDGGLTWSEPEPVLGLRDRFSLGNPYIGELLLKFEPLLKDVLSHCKLVVEQPEIYSSITVNKQVVDFGGSGFYLDNLFRSQDITPMLRVGLNEIILTLEFVSAVPSSTDAQARYGSEIESIYLIGDFAVLAEESDSPLSDTDRNRSGLLQKKPVHSFKRFILAPESATFRGDEGVLDLVLQGYPFFAGEFELETALDLPAIACQVASNERLLLLFPYFEAIVLNVTVNGIPCGTLFTSPWELDVTGFLKPGANTIRVSLANSLRNLMGPHHHKGGEHVAVGPATFRANNNWPNIGRGENDWYDARREGRAKSWSDDYYMIPLGFLQPPILLRAG